METNNSAIIDKAAGIILNTGLEALTIHNLAKELKVEKNQLYNQLLKDDDIILILLMAFETDIIEFVKETETKNVNPESELKLLFKGLYFLFLQKPYYLSLIFDKSLMSRDESIKHSVLRIRLIAEDYLTRIIDKGKKQNNFKTNESTKFLVNKILADFRLFMKDEQRLNELMLEFNTLKTIND
jgi:AcrR family transcriptional regulator